MSLKEGLEEQKRYYPDGRSRYRLHLSDKHLGYRIIGWDEDVLRRKNRKNIREYTIVGFRHKQVYNYDSPTQSTFWTDKGYDIYYYKHMREKVRGYKILKGTTGHVWDRHGSIRCSVHWFHGDVPSFADRVELLPPNKESRRMLMKHILEKRDE